MAGHEAVVFPAGFSGFSVQLLKCCIVVVILHRDELIYLVVKIELCTRECSQCSAAKRHHAGTCGFCLSSRCRPLLPIVNAHSYVAADYIYCMKQMQSV